MKKQPPATGTPHPVNEQASGWMKRGIGLLEENTAASLGQAVQCFDRAIALRLTLPLDGNPLFRYGLAAGWMNRGDALSRLGGNLDEAVRSYDEALAVLRELPVEGDPRFRRRRAVAWLNRGIALEAGNTPARRLAAVRSFTEAIAVLEDREAAGGVEERKILAAAWMNRGNILVQRITEQEAHDEEAREAAKKSLALIGAEAESEPVAAEISFKARHVLCRAVAHLLEGSGTVAAGPEELLADATDAVDEAMKLARHWEAQGVVRFRPQVAELFRFGCLVYQTRQPHFLTEFLLENLDPARGPGALPDSREMQAAAVSALWRNLRELQGQSFNTINTPGFEQLLEQLHDLRVTDERLRELRGRYSQG